MIERAHARGLKIYGATLTPFEGAAYWTPEGEAKRQALNEWIRTGRRTTASSISTPAIRDPSHPTKILAAVRLGRSPAPERRRLPGDGDAIDLALFRRR